MNNGISITLLPPKNRAEPLMEVEMPTDFSEEASLKYTQKEVREDWGKLHLKRWLMPGLCVLYEDAETLGCDGPVLSISGPHVLIVCYSKAVRRTMQHGAVLATPAAGVFEIRKAAGALVPMVSAPESGNKRLSIIFSNAFLLKLLQHENWIKSHDLYALLDTSSEYCYPYFLELPIRYILNSLVNETFKPLQKRYYFELKLKELFFLLQLQPELSDHKTQIPADVQQKLIAAKAYLLANYHLAPTIKQLSRIVSLNEFKLKQFFKMLFGTTIKSYVIAIRMEEARNLLWKNRSVNDVAIHLGYKNVSHFILIFKRTFGETPKQMVHKQESNQGICLLE